MSKRKPLNSTPVKLKAPVAPIVLDDCFLEARGRGKFFFGRLKYKGVPQCRRGRFSTSKNFYVTTELIDMKRDGFIRMIYGHVANNFTSTTKTYCDQIVRYIAYLDENHLVPFDGDYFSNEFTHRYIKQLKEQAKAGIKPTLAINARCAISFFLKALERHNDSKALPEVPNIKNPTQGVDIEKVIKPATRALSRAYRVFCEHIRDDTLPDIHPIYNEVEFNAWAEQSGLSLTARVKYFCLFKNAVMNYDASFIEDEVDAIRYRRLATYNGASRCAALLCFILTGANFKPLLSMRRSDVKFKQVHGARYVFESTKGRAGYREQDNALGFSKRTKEFVESWLDVTSFHSENNPEDWLFPYFFYSGEVTNCANSRADIYKINKLLKYHGIPHINSTKLRKTKADTLMKVTEEVFLVAMSMNNEIKTVQASYTSGLEQDHERNLAAAMDAQHSLSQGEPLSSAVSKSKFKFKDVLSEYEYKERLRPAALTPIGIRCESDKSMKRLIKRQLKSINIDLPEEEQKCTNFFDCFGCENHILVASVDDIWMMLSFYEVLLSLCSAHSLNSVPKKKFTDLVIQIESALARLKEKDRKSFYDAKEKLKNAQHPLYETVRSLEDLVEVFG